MAEITVLGHVRADAAGDAMMITPEELLRQALVDMEAGAFTPDGLVVIGLTREGGVLDYRWRAAKMHASDLMVACDLVKRDAVAAID